ncbi:MAG: response regulator transcription factor [Phycisphaerales bacterium]
MRILCVDDSADIAELLSRLIRREPDLEDAGALQSADGLVDEVVRRRADVVVLDLSMPGPEPLEAIRALTVSAPLCRVIAYSGHDDPETKEAVRGAGASELVSKNGEPGDIIRAIRRAVNAGGC